jgi:hypothetical protein
MKILVRAAAALLLLSLGLIAAQSNTTSTAESSTPFTIPVYLADGTPLTGLHEVVGTILVSENRPTVTLTGPAAFRSANSYFCTATNANLNQGFISILNVDGAHFVIRNFSVKPVPAAYRCIGN